MQYTDTQLKQALAKMLPEKLVFLNAGYEVNNILKTTISRLYYRTGREVLDTELLHLCWLVEETLQGNDMFVYHGLLIDSGCDFRYHATWQQRTIALAKVKGVEI